MEKSMIMDLDNMRTSMGYKNTFTTSFYDGGYELKKSKISNLPSYKKSDLSVKLPFVVVFQTMEIQRLSEQIEALRVALKDSQRQAFNCQSYQVQIRQLTDQCHQYDIELGEYREEVQKLNMVSQKLYEELEDWKQKYQNFDPLVQQKYNVKAQQCQNLQNQIGKWKDRFKALQKSKDKQLEDLKLAMESQRKSVLDRQIKQLNIKFEAQRNYLQNQLKKMQQAADQRESELTQAKYEAEALRIQNEANLDATRKLKQADNKLNKMAEEQVRLNELLRRKQEQIERKDADEDYLKQMLKSLERQKIAQQNQAIKVPQLQGIVKQWVLRYSRLQSQSNEMRQQLERIPNMEKNLQSCAVELERLGMIVKAKVQQINQLNTKADKYKTMHQQSKKSEEKVPGLERRITQLGYESQRLNDILKKRLIQIEQGKSRITALERALRVFEQAEPEKRRIEQEYKRQIRQIEKQKKQIIQFQKEVRKIPQLESIIVDERTVREQYTRQVDRLNKVTKDKSEQNQTLNEKVYYLENKVAELSNIEEELTNYKNQNNRMVQQIDSMNSKIKTKCEQLQVLTESVLALQRNLQHYKQVQQKLIQNIENTQKLIQELNQTKNDLQRTEASLLECEAELNEAKNTIVEINNDKEMLNRNLNLKTQELEHAKAEINEYLEQINKLREIERLYYLLQQQMRMTINRLKQTEESLHKTEEYLRKETAKNEQLQYKNQMLNNELEHIHQNGYFPEQFRVTYASMKANATNKQKRIEELMKKQQGMAKFVDQVQGMVFNICETVKVRNAEWNQIKDKIGDSAGNIKKIAALQDENNQLRMQNLDLQSQIKMLNLDIGQVQHRKSIKQNPFSTQAGSTLQPPTLGGTGTGSSWRSFNTVPSKKAIDSIVEDQTGSRVSSSSNNRILTSTGNIVTNSTPMQLNMNSASKSKLEQASRSSSKLSGKHLNLNAHITSSTANNTSSVYQLNASPSSASIHSARGISGIGNGLSSTNGLSGLSGLSASSYVSPSKMGMTTPTAMSTTAGRTTISKESTESYYTTKTSKTSSVRQPFTFKSSYRA